MVNRAIPLSLLLVLSMMAVPGLTSAQDSGDDNLVTVDFQSQEPDTRLGKIKEGIGAFAGFASRMSPTNFLRDVTGNEPTPDGQAEELQTFLNENEQQFVTHTNTVADEYNATVGDGNYVLELTIEDADDSSTTETIYFVGTGNGTDVTGYNVVNSTDKTVDRSDTMDAFDAEDLNEDIREYHEEYVDNDTVPERSYYIKLASRYGDVSEITIGGS